MHITYSWSLKSQFSISCDDVLNFEKLEFSDKPILTALSTFILRKVIICDRLDTGEKPYSTHDVESNVL
jgi:hypothetical protein